MNCFFKCIAAAAALSLPFATEPAAAAAIGSWGVDLSDQNRSVRPGDDFAMYQNGGWFNRTELKPGQSLSAYWRDVRVAGTLRVDEMMTSLDSQNPANQDRIEALVARFHRSGDDKIVNRKGLAPLGPTLRTIRSIKNKRQFAQLMGAVEGPGTLRYVQSRLIPGRNFYGVNIVQDQQDPSHYAIFISQAGLILPGPEYYTDPAFKDLKATYQAGMAKMLRHIGWADPERSARQIVELETKVAVVHSSLEELRDPAKTFHRVTLAQLSRQAPGVDWRAFFRGAELPTDALIAVDVPEADRRHCQSLCQFAARRAQGKGSVRRDPGRCAAPRFIDLPNLQGFRGLDRPWHPGQSSQKNEITNLIEDSVQDAISAVWVKRYFSPEVKAKALTMAMMMKDALDRRVLQSPWLSPEGKRLVHAKVSTMEISVGYPDRLDDYRGLVIKDDDLFGNASRSAAHNWHKQVAQLKRRHRSVPMVAGPILRANSRVQPNDQFAHRAGGDAGSAFLRHQRR